MTAPAGNNAFVADPKAVYDEKDYGFKYATWLALGGADTISVSTWEYRNAKTDEVTTDLVEISATVIDANKTSQVWLRGGVRGTTYRVINKITTAGGRKQELAFLLPVV